MENKSITARVREMMAGLPVFNRADLDGQIQGAFEGIGEGQRTWQLRGDEQTHVRTSYSEEDAVFELTMTARSNEAHESLFHLTITVDEEGERFDALFQGQLEEEGMAEVFRSDMALEELAGLLSEYRRLHNEIVARA